MKKSILLPFLVSFCSMALANEVFRKTVSAEVIREGYHLQMPELASGTYVLMLNNSNYNAVKRLVK